MCNSRNSRVGPGMVRFWICAVLLGLSGQLQGEAESSSPPRAQSALEPPVVRGSPLEDGARGVMLFRGRLLSYEVIHGRAVHGGDMILGTAAEAAASPRPPVADGLQHIRPTARAIAAVGQDLLWPEGKIPYVVDSGIPADQQENIAAAAAAWNSKTVITWSPRQAERHFVRFQPAPPGPCHAHVGRSGRGEQGILIPPSGCDVNSLVHEMGHAVGLYHEHEREDRDAHLAVQMENLSQSAAAWYLPSYVGSAPYNYRSTMHYGPFAASRNGRPVLETIPPGMEIPAGGLSPGDIDGVARLYGRPPSQVTVATNPPGLDLIVDGVRVTTPAQFSWAAGTEHSLEAPTPQAREGSRFLFGRWNDEGGRCRTVVADPARTWYEANFIVQHYVSTSSTPDGAGTVTISPDSPDGYYTLRTPVQVSAAPATASSYDFVLWNGLLAGDHGRSSNPARHTVTGPGREYAAFFSRQPLFRFRSSVDPILIQIDGQTRAAPLTLRTSDLGTSVTLRVPEVQQISRLLHGRYRFDTWSDGGGPSHQLDVPAEGGELTLSVTPEYRLTTGVRFPGEDRISLVPPSDDGFYAVGTQVTATAEPAPGRVLANWVGDAAGDSPVQIVAMDGVRHLEAAFTTGGSLRAGVPKQLVLPTSAYQFQAYFYRECHVVHVPPGATRMTVGFQSSQPAAEVDLYVQRGGSPSWHLAADDRTPVFNAHFRSTDAGANERVTVTAASAPALAAGGYYIGLVTYNPRQRIAGTLRVDIEGAAEWVQGTPGAFTFVATAAGDPPSQQLRLDLGGAGNSAYRLESDHPWLTPTPQRWSFPPTRTQSISVAVAAAGLEAGTYNTVLRIVRLAGQAATGSSASVTGVAVREFPVALAVLPPEPPAVSE